MLLLDVILETREAMFKKCQFIEVASDRIPPFRLRWTPRQVLQGKRGATVCSLQSKSSFESAASLRHKERMENKADVIIIGGGLIGLTQALALASQGITSHVIDRADQAGMLDASYDGRTFAISSSSYKLFEAKIGRAHV